MAWALSIGEVPRFEGEPVPQVSSSSAASPVSANYHPLPRPIDPSHATPFSKQLWRYTYNHRWEWEHCDMWTWGKRLQQQPDIHSCGHWEAQNAGAICDLHAGPAAGYRSFHPDRGLLCQSAWADVHLVQQWRESGKLLQSIANNAPFCSRTLKPTSFCLATEHPVWGFGKMSWLCCVCCILFFAALTYSAHPLGCQSFKLRRRHPPEL